MHGSWDEMIDAVALRSGRYTGRAKYSFVRCYVQGFGDGRGDDVLADFHEWLLQQPLHRGSNYVWWALLLREVFIDLRGTDLGYPREDDLVYPDEDAVAIKHLFKRLREFLSSNA